MIFDIYTIIEQLVEFIFYFLKLQYVVHKLGFTSVTDKHMPKYMRKHQQHKHNYN